MTIEKTRDIATLKIVGAPDRTIAGLILQEALTLGRSRDMTLERTSAGASRGQVDADVFRAGRSVLIDPPDRPGASGAAG